MVETIKYELSDEGSVYRIEIPEKCLISFCGILWQKNFITESFIKVARVILPKNDESSLDALALYFKVSTEFFEYEKKELKRLLSEYCNKHDFSLEIK